MNKFLRLCIIAVVMLALAACGGDGGGGDSRIIYVAQILSDQPADGHIAYNSNRQLYIITDHPNTLFFGIDNSALNLIEYRAFLDFPLDGSTKGDIVPSDAVIVSATLEVFVTEVSFANTVPTVLDLVSYPVSGLRPQDFSSPPLMVQRLNFFRSDQGKFITIDVTALMREAQRQRLPDLQVRFLLEPLASNGFVGIDDRPSVTITAPRLTVRYE